MVNTLTQYQIIHWTRCDMGMLHIDISQLTVPSGHFQAGMSEHPLQTEDIATVAQEFHRRRVAQGMR